MKDDSRELLIPPKALHDKESKEVLRAWVVPGEDLHCSLRPDAWDDSGAWGIALADVARHVSNALFEDRGQNKLQTLNRIREIFNAEIDSPTDEPFGKFI